MSDEQIWGQVAAWIWSKRNEVGKSLADLYQWYRGDAREPNTGSWFSVLAEPASPPWDGFSLDSMIHCSMLLNRIRRASESKSTR